MTHLRVNIVLLNFSLIIVFLFYGCSHNEKNIPIIEPENVDSIKNAELAANFLKDWNDSVRDNGISERENFLKKSIEYYRIFANWGGGWDLYYQYEIIFSDDSLNKQVSIYTINPKPENSYTIIRSLSKTEWATVNLILNELKFWGDFIPKDTTGRWVACGSREFLITGKRNSLHKTIFWEGYWKDTINMNYYLLQLLRLAQFPFPEPIISKHKISKDSFNIVIYPSSMFLIDFYSVRLNDKDMTDKAGLAEFKLHKNNLGLIENCIVKENYIDGTYRQYSVAAYSDIFDQESRRIKAADKWLKLFSE